MCKLWDGTRTCCILLRPHVRLHSRHVDLAELASPDVQKMGWRAHLLHLLRHLVRLRGRQVHLVEHGHDGQVLVKGLPQYPRTPDLSLALLINVQRELHTLFHGVDSLLMQG